MLYAEAKAAMVAHDTRTAKTLMAHVPKGYRNVDAYRRQCDAYDALCGEGILRRPETLLLRRRIAQVLDDREDEGRDVSRYADALERAGYTAAIVEACTLMDVDEIADAARMRAGHRRLLQAHAAANTSCVGRVWMLWLHVLGKCAPLFASSVRRAAD